MNRVRGDVHFRGGVSLAFLYDGERYLVRLFQRPKTSLSEKIEADPGELERIVQIIRQFRRAKGYIPEHAFHFGELALVLQGDKSVICRPEMDTGALGWTESASVEKALISLFLGAETKVI